MSFGAGDAFRVRGTRPLAVALRIVAAPSGMLVGDIAVLEGAVCIHTPVDAANQRCRNLDWPRRRQTCLLEMKTFEHQSRTRLASEELALRHVMQLLLRCTPGRLDKRAILGHTSAPVYCVREVGAAAVSCTHRLRQCRHEERSVYAAAVVWKMHLPQPPVVGPQTAVAAPQNMLDFERVPPPPRLAKPLMTRRLFSGS